MSVPRVRVGLPIDSPRGAGRIQWSPQTARRDTALARRVLNRSRNSKTSGDPIMAPAKIAEKPLSFLSARNFFILFAVAAISIFVVGLLVRSNHLAVSHSYEISELTQEKMDLLEINRQLKTELAEVASLEHLEKAARETLGLVSPQKGQIVVIE